MRKLVFVFLLEPEPGIAQNNRAGMVQPVHDVIPGQSVPEAHDQKQEQISD